MRPGWTKAFTASKLTPGDTPPPHLVFTVKILVIEQESHYYKTLFLVYLPVSSAGIHEVFRCVL